jgi:transcriptional regulator with XRE-family HTH domain
MKRYKANGAKIKSLRENREQHSTQKEFAYAIGISERRLRQIENSNGEITAAILYRMAEVLGVPHESVVFSIGRLQPVTIVEANGLSTSVVRHRADEPRVVPRFDTAHPRAVSDEAALISDVSRCHIVVSHILTNLTKETEDYIEELLKILQLLTWNHRDPLKPPEGHEELAIRRRVRQLLVLLKGNEIWVYVDTHIKQFPETLTVQEKQDFNKKQWQLILAFGAPGEYGEVTVTVPIDHGQPWIADLKKITGH